jgi:hypothetical protein
MKHIWITFIIIMVVVFMNGCKKDSSATSSSDQYTNQLTLGTGMNGFNITGETTSFSRIGGQANIYWRLESAKDMGGSSVTIAIDKQGSGGFVSYYSQTYPSPQSYGNIMLSSIVIADTGSFRATGILVTGNVTVATKNFTVH